MKKCVRILFSADVPRELLRLSIKKHAYSCSIEGGARIIPSNKKIELLACGKKEEVDNFIDLIHSELLKAAIYDIQVEPFIKEKDYRGIFRVIE